MMVKTTGQNVQGNSLKVSLLRLLTHRKGERYRHKGVRWWMPPAPVTEHSVPSTGQTPCLYPEVTCWAVHPTLMSFCQSATPESYYEETEKSRFWDVPQDTWTLQKMIVIQKIKNKKK